MPVISMVFDPVACVRQFGLYEYIDRASWAAAQETRGQAGPSKARVVRPLNFIIVK